MCRAVPRRVLAVDDRRVEVDYDGRATWVHAAALDGLTVGEYVLVYAAQAYERVSREEAEELLEFEAELERLLEEASREEARR